MLQFLFLLVLDQKEKGEVERMSSHNVESNQSPAALTVLTGL